MNTPAKCSFNGIPRQEGDGCLKKTRQTRQMSTGLKPPLAPKPLTAAIVSSDFCGRGCSLAQKVEQTEPERDETQTDYEHRRQRFVSIPSKMSQKLLCDYYGPASMRKTGGDSKTRGDASSHNGGGPTDRSDPDSYRFLLS